MEAFLTPGFSGCIKKKRNVLRQRGFKDITKINVNTGSPRSTALNTACARFCVSCKMSCFYMGVPNAKVYWDQKAIVSSSDLLLATAAPNPALACPTHSPMPSWRSLAWKSSTPTAQPPGVQPPRPPPHHLPKAPFLSNPPVPRLLLLSSDGAPSSF